MDGDAQPGPEIELTDGPLPPRQRWDAAGAGAVVCFEGIVRPLEDDRPIDALRYEAYEPMTTSELRQLAEQLIAEHDLLAMRIEHSVGIVGVGECSFRLLVAAAHRGPALKAMEAFIDRMKQSVPLWKTPVWAAKPGVMR